MHCFDVIESEVEGEVAIEDECEDNITKFSDSGDLTRSRSAFVREQFRDLLRLSCSRPRSRFRSLTLTNNYFFYFDLTSFLELKDIFDFH